MMGSIPAHWKLVDIPASMLPVTTALIISLGLKACAAG